MQSTNEWGNEELNKKHTLFRQKGLRDTSTTGRFVTSTKPWLDNYESVKKSKTRNLRFNSVVVGGVAG